VTEKPARRERKQVQASKTCVDVDLIVNEKLGFYKDDRAKAIRAFEAWLTDVLMRDRKQSRAKKDRCEICNSKEDYSKLELHHYGESSTTLGQSLPARDATTYCQNGRSSGTYDGRSATSQNTCERHLSFLDCATCLC
jgi:hypothetical protein